MRLTQLAGPAAEPLSRDDLKAHLRIDHDDEDGLLDSLIVTSRLQIETAIGLALITQQWRWQADCWPGAIIELATRPVQTIDRVFLRDGDGAETVIDPLDYIVDLGGPSARLTHRSGSWPRPPAPIAGAGIDFTAGYGLSADLVPEQIRHALKLLATHWYEVRGPEHIGAGSAKVPPAISNLLSPYKVHRI